MWRLCRALSLLLGIYILPIPVVSAECVAQISKGKGEIVFDGCISDSTINELMVSLEANDRLNLFFASNGGAVEAAIRLANFLQDKEIRVAVFDRCNSSCANYILPISVGMVLRPRTRVILHGDANVILGKITPRSVGDNLYAQLQRIAKLERNLQDRSAVVGDIHALQVIARHPRDQYVKVTFQGVALRCRGHGITEWSPPISLLQRLGVANETLPFSPPVEVLRRKTVGKVVPVLDPLGTCRGRS